MDGLILVDKPQGATSHDIVGRLRRILGLRQIGHFGTLDPLATGLIVIAVGRAVKLFPVFSKEDKVYAGRVRFGFATDTYDAWGRPTTPVSDHWPPRPDVAGAMSELVGELAQVPPPYSAKKFAGKPLYEWARSQRPVAAAARPVRVQAFDLKDYQPPFAEFEVRCGAGTYIRSLAHELGRKLGCGAHLASLKRLAAGEFRLSEAHSMDEVEGLGRQGGIRDVLISLESLFPKLPRVELSEAGGRRVQKGRAILEEEIRGPVGAAPAGSSGGSWRLFGPEGRFLGLARLGSDRQRLVPFLLLR
jgi:tRNA pseudouridine55 synthase